MLIDTDAELLRLQAVLRDIVALSTIPATWIGREPAAVAAGLADALIGLLQVDFAYVRLCDPGGAGAVDAMVGDATVVGRRPGCVSSCAGKIETDQIEISKAHEIPDRLVIGCKL